MSEITTLYAAAKAKVVAVVTYFQVHYKQLAAALLVGHYSSIIEKVIALVHKVL